MATYGNYKTLSFQAASVLGIDADPNLIDQARSHLSFRYSRSQPNSDLSPPAAADYFPISSILEHGHRPWPDDVQSALDRDVDICSVSRDEEPATFPGNVHFQCEDWVEGVQGSPASLAGNAGSADVILALSVVKWVHLRHLDAGLNKFFLRCSQTLCTGGYLVLEIQPWSSYEKAVRPKKSPQLAANFALLQVKPDDFPALLDRYGFVSAAVSDELPRRICVYKKVKGPREPASSSI
ncbi:MAG: hypothetical protein M4579_000560 [Chaenotheca gracillima]|nr:MAG: hypothetical protein M4579_000560 [Chaenotheca gracillima]